jgi:hypothetical protein
LIAKRSFFSFFSHFLLCLSNIFADICVLHTQANGENKSKYKRAKKRKKDSFQRRRKMGWLCG